MGFLDSIKKLFSPKEGEDRASLSKRVQASPQDPQARQKLGIFLLRQGEVVEGLDQLARAAVMYEKDGFAGKAVAVLRQMLKNDPSNVDFLRWLIRLLAQEGLAADAVREVENAAGRIGLFTGEEQRMEFLRNAAESLPRSPLPRLYLADALRSQRKFHEAINELEKASRHAVSAGMVPEFSERLALLVTMAGDETEIMEPCGFLWLRVGKDDEAFSLLTRVIEKTREEGNLARVAEMEAVLGAMREGFDAAASGAVSFDDAAKKILEQGTAPAPVAETAPERETAPPPRKPEAAVEGTDYREEKSIVEDALARLQAKVHEEIGDSDPDARYNLGIAYKEMGLLDEAAGEFRLALQKPELLVGASSLLADTLAAKGALREAVETLDEALSSGFLSETETRDVRYHKAGLLARDGREEEAGQIFLSIFEESPEYRNVAELAQRYRR